MLFKLLFPLLTLTTLIWCLTPFLLLDVANHFKYEIFWEEHVECRNVVTVGWNSSSVIEVKWKVYASKASNCKRSLGVGKKKTFKNVAVEISKLKGKLQILLNGGDTLSKWEEVKRIKKEIDGLWKQEVMYWGLEV